MSREVMFCGCAVENAHGQSVVESPCEFHKEYAGLDISEELKEEEEEE